MIRQLARTALVALALLGAGVAVVRPAAGTGAPTGTDDAAAGSLAAMLGRMPALDLGGEAQAMVFYADLATQLAAVGFPPDPTTAEIDRETILIRQLLAFPHTAPYIHQDDWRETFGFGLAEVDQTIEYAAPPLFLTIYRGRFDRDMLIQAWTNEGYRPVEVDETTIYTIRDDLEIDFQSRSGRMALSSMNHAVILDETTIAFASVRDVLTSAIAAAAGSEPTLAEDDAIAPLLPNLPADLVSAWIVAGDALVWSADPAALLPEATPGATDVDAIATEIATDAGEARRMPPIVAALLGQTAGGPLGDIGPRGDSLPADLPPAKVVVALTMLSHEAAETAAAVVEERLATMAVPPFRPGDDPLAPTYAALFPEAALHVADAEPVVVVELTQGPPPSQRILIDLLVRRSLTLLAWAP